MCTWKPRRIWQDNIKTKVKEIGFHGVNWIHLAEDRDKRRIPVILEMKLRVP
jgi:hypothetical protein